MQHTKFKAYDALLPKFYDTLPHICILEILESKIFVLTSMSHPFWKPVPSPLEKKKRKSMLEIVFKIFEIAKHASQTILFLEPTVLMQMNT